MANEINITQDAGLTLTAKVYTLAGVQQGSTVSLTEVVTGIYSGNFSLTGVSDGRYTVLFFNGTTIVGFGSIFVVDELEVDIHKLETRLQSIAEHDATQATLANKLDTSAYTAPDNAGIAAIKAKTDNLPSDPADQSLLIAAIDAVPTTGEIRTELATELARIDVAISTRLSGSSYIIPDNIGIQAIEDAIPTLATAISVGNLPTLAEIEASTTLAKESTVATKLNSSSYTAPDNAGIAAIKAKTDGLNFTGTDVKATLDGEQVLASNMVSLTGIATATDVTSATSAIVSAIGEVPTSSENATALLNRVV